MHRTRCPRLGYNGGRRRDRQVRSLEHKQDRHTGTDCDGRGDVLKINERFKSGTAGGKGPRFMQGAALMGVAMLFSKTLGTLQKIPLQNLAGDRVFGIYNAVYPLYQLLLVMVTAGFPLRYRCSWLSGKPRMIGPVRQGC